MCGSRKLPISLINWELSLIVRLPFGHIFTALIASVSASFRSRAALQLEIVKVSGFRSRAGTISPFATLK